MIGGSNAAPEAGREFPGSDAQGVACALRRQAKKQQIERIGEGRKEASIPHKKWQKMKGNEEGENGNLADMNVQGRHGQTTHRGPCTAR